MIINLRGTSGAGKSTVVRNILQRWPHEVVESRQKARSLKPLVYRTGPTGSPLFIFGSYVNECGGCDTITDYKTVIPELLPRYAAQGSILYEGMLISATYGSIGPVLAELEKLGHGLIFAYMDTPIEVCLDRIRARRIARGDLRELNPKNTLSKHGGVVSSMHRIGGVLGHRVMMIDHIRAEEQVLELLGLSAAPIQPSVPKEDQLNLF